MWVRSARNGSLGGALVGLVIATAAHAQQAPGDHRMCQTYAANVAGIGDLAIKRNPACLDYSKGVHGNFKMHYDWCINHPQTEVRGAEANIRRLAALCTGNRPAPTAAPASAPAVFSGGKRLGGNCAKRYREWQGKRGAKAFALSMDGGRCGWSSANGTVNDAQAKALAACGGRADAPCMVTEAIR